MYTNFEELVVDYESGELHPDNLKSALSKSLNEILEVMFTNYVYATFIYSLPHKF
jgi:tyrosyl-tRNA synthetase